jgi:large subunit ribosomal protein L9
MLFIGDGVLLLLTPSAIDGDLGEFYMANTTILLREDIDNVGGRGEIVKVKAGYARNYLLPHGFASLATKGNVKQIEQERSALLKRVAIEKATAEAQRGQMESLTLEFVRKAGEHGTLFGSVTSMDVAEALQKKGYEIDRRKIVMKDAIKETGEYTVNVKLHREVTLTVPVTVTAEGGEPELKPERKAKKEPKPAVEEPKSEEPKAEAPAEEISAEAPAEEVVAKEAAPVDDESAAAEAFSDAEEAAQEGETAEETPAA